jgi:hypothetical protein
VQVLSFTASNHTNKSTIGRVSPEPAEQTKGSEMPNIVTADELRVILGVSDSLYSDAYLDQIIESAEATILPMLTQYQSAVVATRITDDVLFIDTLRPNFFVQGQEVILAGIGNGLDGPYTVSDHSVRPFQVTAVVDEADRITTPCIPAGTITLDGGSAAAIYASVPAVKTAILIVSTEIFQSVTAPGGQIEGVDFAPTPFRMGRSLQNRVIGLISAFYDVDSICQ